MHVRCVCVDRKPLCVAALESARTVAEKFPHGIGNEQLRFIVRWEIVMDVVHMVVLDFLYPLRVR